MPLEWAWEPEAGFRILLWNCETDLQDQSVPRRPNSSAGEAQNAAIHRMFLQLAGEQYVLEKDEYGRPYLSKPDCFAAISHAGPRVVCGLHDKMPCGLDVERFHPRLLRVAERFLMPEEKAAVNQEDPIPMLTLAWSAKEALYKWYGRKKLESKDILLELPEPAEAGQFPARVMEKGNEHQLIVHYRRIADGWVTAVCKAW
jgi:phosphopantetheinyl transferase